MCVNCCQCGKWKKSVNDETVWKPAVLFSGLKRHLTTFALFYFHTVPGVVVLLHQQAHPVFSMYIRRRKCTCCTFSTLWSLVNNRPMKFFEFGATASASQFLHEVLVSNWPVIFWKMDLRFDIDPTWHLKLTQSKNVGTIFSSNISHNFDYFVK